MDGLGEGESELELFGIVARDNDGGEAEAADELVLLVFGAASEDGGAGDFVAVEMEDGKNATVAGAAEESAEVH